MPGISDQYDKAIYLRLITKDFLSLAALTTISGPNSIFAIRSRGTQIKNLVAAMTLVAPALSASVQTSAPSTIKAEVNGMVCAFCAQGIEKKIKAMPQAREVIRES